MAKAEAVAKAKAVADAKAEAAAEAKAQEEAKAKAEDEAITPEAKAEAAADAVAETVAMSIEAADIARSRKEQVQARQHHTKTQALKKGAKVMIRETFNSHSFEKFTLCEKDCNQRNTCRVLVIKLSITQKSPTRIFFPWGFLILL